MEFEMLKGKQRGNRRNASTTKPTVGRHRRITVSGLKIVLAASDSESSEYLRSQWGQMLLATLPARYACYLGSDWPIQNEIHADGLATYIPHGLRIIESVLLERFFPGGIAVCCPDQIDQFIGD